MGDRADRDPSRRDAIERMEQICNEFEHQLRSGRPEPIETLLSRIDRSLQPELVGELVALEVEYRQRSGEVVALDEYCRRFPDYSHHLEEVWTSIADHQLSDTDAGAQANWGAGSEEEPATILGGAAVPSRTLLGRYEVRQVLGQGGFGTVYLAWDPKLERQVALKVPSRRFLNSPEKRKLYLDEARAVAQLDHPHIVPVYDVGTTDAGEDFTVSKFIEGRDLAAQMKEQMPSAVQAARWVADAADALHYAHTQGFVHRDVKPANILIDDSGQAYLADFGLALRDEDIGQGPGLVGTPSYMSPEQISGQGHRVDGRSDIFSLGVVLYELLTGRRPFRSQSQLELTEQIRSMEAKPPRQVNDAIPVELERICLKAMAKGVSDRYLTAQDLADDLKATLSESVPAGTAPRVHDSDDRKSPTLKWVLGISGTRGRTVGCAIQLTLCLSAIALIVMFVPPWDQQVSMAPADGNPDTTEDSSKKMATIVDRSGVVQEFSVLASRDESLFQPVDSLAPLRSGDRVRFSIKLNEPAYVRLFWIDSVGEPQELYPDDPERGHLGNTRVTSIESPVEWDRGWPLEGSPGIEAAVLLVSRESPISVSLEDLKTGVPIGTSLESVRRFAASRTDEAVISTSIDDERSLGKSTVRVDNGMLQLLELLRQHADDLKAIAIPHQAQ